MLLMLKVEKNSKLIKLGIFVMAFSLVVLGIRVDRYQKQLKVIENNQQQVSKLLFGDNKTSGLSCGILNDDMAEELLGVSLERSFVQGPANLTTENSPDNRVFWTDNCRYSDPNDSSKYIELFINSYQNSEDAKVAYPYIFGVVNNNEELSAGGLGDKLTYDGGMYTLLKGSRIIQVSANQGSDSNIDTFSRHVFDEIMKTVQTF